MAIIPLETLIPHGKINNTINNNILELKSLNSITSIAYNLVGNSYKRHYLEINKKVHIPFMLTMNINIDYSGLILLIGDGHILFNCPSSRSIEDIVKPTFKPYLDEHNFNNSLPTNKFVEIKIYYGLNEMQIIVDNKEAFYTKKLPYMKAKEFTNLNKQGFDIRIEIAKLSTLKIKQIDITEFDNNITISRPDKYYMNNSICRNNNAIERYSFEEFINRFNDNIKNEISNTDNILKSLKTLKMKRVVDPKGDKLTYSSVDHGISYIIRNANNEWWQSFSFYIVTAGKAETWHRKADYMEEILQEIAKTDLDLANRIFFALNDCVGCYGSRCIVKTPYSFNSKKKLACHGIVKMRLCEEDFKNVQAFFNHLNTLINKKIENNTLQTDKIFLIK